MPTYEYQCDTCGHRFELYQSIKSGPVRKCPACGRRKVRRLISRGGAILFKGGGFYTTDYRSESYKQGAKQDAPPAAPAAPAASGAGGGEAKGATPAKPAKAEAAGQADKPARPGRRPKHAAQ